MDEHSLPGTPWQAPLRLPLLYKMAGRDAETRRRVTGRSVLVVLTADLIDTKICRIRPRFERY